MSTEAEFPGMVPDEAYLYFPGGKLRLRGMLSDQAILRLSAVISE